MTDEDVYGKALGKRFWHLRGELCSADADPADAARAVADYIRRELGDLVPDLAERCVAAVREIAHGGTLFTGTDMFETFGRTSCDNLGTQHVAEALHRTLEEGGDGPAFFRNLAELGVAATRARLLVENSYKDDKELIEAFDRSRIDISETYTRLLAKPHDVPLPAPHERSRVDARDLLDFVVARRTE